MTRWTIVSWMCVLVGALLAWTGTALVSYGEPKVGFKLFIVGLLMLSEPVIYFYFLRDYLLRRRKTQL